jgi:arginyl-tRNA synthetase
VAARLHTYYNAERFLVEDEAVKLARLALVAATRQVLANGLAVLGVSAPERM